MEDESRLLQDLLAGLESQESVLEDRETYTVRDREWKEEIERLEAKLRDYGEQLRQRNTQLACSQTRFDDYQTHCLSITFLSTEISHLNRELEQAYRAKSMLEGKHREALSRLTALISGEELEEEPCQRLSLDITGALEAELMLLTQEINRELMEGDRLKTGTVRELRGKVSAAKAEWEHLQRELQLLKPDVQPTRDNSALPLRDRQVSCSPISESPRSLSPVRCSSIPGSQVSDCASIVSYGRLRKSEKVITSRPAALRKHWKTRKRSPFQT